MKELLTITLLAVLLLPLQLRASLPTEINYPEAERVQEREEAKLAALQETEAQKQRELDAASGELTELERGLERLLNEIRLNRDQRTQLELDNQRLAAEIEWARASIESDRVALDEQASIDRFLSDELQRLSRERQSREVQYQRASQHYQEQTQRFRSAEAARAQDQELVERVQRDFRSSEQRWQQLNRELNQAQNARRTDQQRLPVIQRDIQGQRQQITQLERQLERDRERVSALTREHEQLKRQADQIQNRLTNLEREFEPVARELRQLQNQLSGLQTQLTRAEGQVTRLNQEQNQLRTTLNRQRQQERQLTNEINQADRTVNQSERRFEQLNRQVPGKQQELAAIVQRIRELQSQRPRTPEVEQELRAAQGQRQSLQQEVRALTQERDQAKQALDRALAERTRAQNELRTLVSSIAQNETRLSQMNGEIQSAEREVANLTRQVQAAQTRVTTLEQENRNLLQRIETVRQNARTAQAQADQKQVELRAQVEVQNRNEAELRSQNRELQNNQRELARLEQAIAQADRQISSLSLELRREQQRAQDLEQNLRRAEQALALSQQIERRAADDLAQAQSQWERERRALEELIAQERGIHQQRDDVQREVARLRQQIANREGLIVAHQSRIAQQRQQMTELDQLYPGLLAQQAPLEREIGEQRSRVDLAKEGLARAQAAVRDQEVITAESRAVYQQRLALYRQYENEAMASGRRDAHQFASDRGREAGLRLVQTEAGANAQRMGLKRGQLQGELNGLVEGKRQGYAQGLERGRQSSEDYERGFAHGSEVGEQRAEQQARERVLPQAYREAYNARLGQAENGRQKNLRFLELFDLDQRIEKVQREIELFSQPRRNLSLPEFAYSELREVEVRDQDKACLEVYKQVTELKQACLGTYQTAYRETFKREHQREYFAVYANLYAEVYPAAFEAGLDDLYDQAFAEASEVSFNEGLVVGKKEAEDRGFLEGEQRGFRDSWPAAERAAIAEARVRVDQHFKTQAVVRTAAVGGQDPFIAPAQASFKQGSTIALGLKLFNFGEVASRSGDVTVRFRIVSGAAHVSSRSEITLAGMAPRRASALEDLVKVVIDPMARPGSQFRLEARLSYRGDDFVVEHSETVSFTGVVRENPTVQSRLSYETKPQFRTIFFNYPEHEVKVTLQGQNADVPGEYQVELAPATSQDAGRMEIVSARAGLGQIQAGQSKTGVLKYKFNKHAKNQTVRLKVTIKYKGAVLSSETISVQPD